MLIGVIFGGMQAAGIYIAVRRSPIPPGTPFFSGLRDSMNKLGPRSRQWVAHPWRMTVLYVVGWVAFSLILGGRLAINR